MDVFALQRRYGLQTFTFDVIEEGGYELRLEIIGYGL